MRNKVVGLFILLVMLSATPTAAQVSPANNDFDPFAQSEQFLPVDQAFQFDFRQRDNVLTLSWDIAPEYYLYQHRFIIKSDIALSQAPELPPGEAHFDEFFGDSVVYRDHVSIDYHIASASSDQALVISYQGCADAGLCYPPTEQTIYLNAVKGDGSAAIAFADLVANSQSTQSSTANDRFELSQQPLWLALIIFIGLGIGLAFTPCVLPMYPILSAIIFGQQSTPKPIPTRRAFTLSFSYVQGMALTYSSLGIVVALAGMQYQAMLQHPAVLVVLALLFVLLAASMLGLFTLQLPHGWQQRINAMSQQQRGGAHRSVFLMGALSGLIASPCTTAPLSAILLFIAQSGDVVVGASALYALSLGMGIPLIVFGATGGKLLPKAGAWMNTVKRLFGVIMLGVALVFVERLVSVNVADWLWIALVIFAATYMLWTSFIDFTGKRAYTMAALWAFIAALLLSSWWPQPSQQHYPFVQVSSLEEIQQQLEIAAQNEQLVMLDLYADWCVACKEFERYTFTNPQVKQQLDQMLVLQADVTANNAVNNAIWTHYQVLGLPTVLFFAGDQEVSAARLTGFLAAEDFLKHLQRHQLAEKKP